MKFKQMKDSEWFAPTLKNHKMACCDCGLVHTLDFKILIRAKRDKKLTSKRRKTIKKKV